MEERLHVALVLSVVVPLLFIVAGISALRRPEAWAAVNKKLIQSAGTAYHYKMAERSTPQRFRAMGWVSAVAGFSILLFVSLPAWFR